MIGEKLICVVEEDWPVGQPAKQGFLQRLWAPQRPSVPVDPFGNPYTNEYFLTDRGIYAYGTSCLYKQEKIPAGRTDPEASAAFGKVIREVKVDEEHQVFIYFETGDVLALLDGEGKFLRYLPASEDPSGYFCGNATPMPIRLKNK